MIVVDSSALVAIIAAEPDHLAYAEAIERTDAAVISAMNYVELGIVVILRGHMADARELDDWLGALNISVAEDDPLSATALAAYLDYGKGVHPAGLNLADCFAYALAKRLDAPLLYKGEDFARTDIRSALQPT